ncbi:MAG: hypothetical protein O3B70_06705 [Bacteroidetes bacterium]|nr:hypothetical protein [Bacteroidota bacterium]
MDSRKFSWFSPCMSLPLWLALLAIPWMNIHADQGPCALEWEQHENETESEEWQIEWDENLLIGSLYLHASLENWHVAQLHNVILLERLDARPLLDPPEA